ncbi:MAG: ABC transporter ATP-binding protein/permease [Peptostreptococcaceae bacterium]|jgi:ATP-binding cassette subfamily B protein|nr:ABC transporter ATP-binding protein/permease [Peptostreptococcaceae bacterium]
MFGLIRKIIKDDIKKLYLPITLMILDSFFAATFFGVLYLLIIDLINQTFDNNKLKLYSIVLFIAFSLRVVIVISSYTLNHLRGADIIANLRINVSEHLRTLNLGYFNKNTLGNLISCITTDIANFERVITHSLGDLTKSIFLSSYIIIISLFLDLKMGFSIVIMIALSIPLFYYMKKYATKFGLRKNIIVNEVISRIMEYIDGIKVFRSHNQTGKKFKRLLDSFNNFKKESIMLEVMLAPFNLLYSIIIDFIIPIILLLGSYLLLGGNIDKNIFITFIVIALSISNILKSISLHYSEYKCLEISANKILTVLNKKALDYRYEEFDFENFDIEFKNVKFAYEEDLVVIKDISFLAKQGSMSALIGPSGSGKTTIFNLITRFFDISEGQILIGNQDINDINPEFLLRNISMVFQDVYLLNDTVYNNIVMGKKNITKEEVIDICKKANCHDFIMKMEKGYDTLISEGGNNLSGGEKQRISIARALLKDAKIVLLDEATASLDADNENEIRQALNTLIKGKTTIVIAHKLNTITNADNIIVLDKGKILEEGNHNILVSKNGYYKKVYKEQLEAKTWVI